MIVMMYRLTPHSWGFLFVGGWVDLDIILWKSLLNYFLGEHISKKFKKALREIDADENKSFHSLRHTFTVRKLIQGAYIYHLKLIMGQWVADCRNSAIHEIWARWKSRSQINYNDIKNIGKVVYMYFFSLRKRLMWNGNSLAVSCGYPILRKVVPCLRLSILSLRQKAFTTSLDGSGWNFVEEKVHAVKKNTLRR